MWNKNRVTALIRLKYPIIQAPMAGGPTTPALVAAVSNAGGLGSLGAAYHAPERLREEVRQIRQLTQAPFAVNLFTLQNPPPPSPAEIQESVRALAPFRAELGLPPLQAFPERSSETLEQQLQVVLDEKPPVFSFTFGIPPAGFLEECKKAGITTIGTATHLDEAKALQTAGADLVCVQGSEAGGHRGTFMGQAEEVMTGTLALVPRIIKEIQIPVIAAGGIMNGKGIAAACAMGAQAVQLGTAFLLCPEAGTSAPYRAALTHPAAARTAITRAFSGREARGIRNRFMSEMPVHSILPYPYQNVLTRELRQAAAAAGHPEFLSLWAGQAVGLIREMPAGELLKILVRETEEALGKLSAR